MVLKQLNAVKQISMVLLLLSKKQRKNLHGFIHFGENWKMKTFFHIWTFHFLVFIEKSQWKEFFQSSFSLQKGAKKQEFADPFFWPPKKRFWREILKRKNVGCAFVKKKKVVENFSVKKISSHVVKKRKEKMFADPEILFADTHAWFFFLITGWDILCSSSSFLWAVHLTSLRGMSACQTVSAVIIKMSVGFTPVQMGWLSQELQQSESEDICATITDCSWLEMI